MNALAMQLLEALYFVEPYQRLREELKVPEAVLKDELRRLISLGWIQVMQWDPKINDFVRSEIYDSHHLEAYAFVITHQGLLQSNQHFNA